LKVPLTVADAALVKVKLAELPPAAALSAAEPQVLPNGTSPRPLSMIACRSAGHLVMAGRAPDPFLREDGPGLLDGGGVKAFWCRIALEW
jgi:hypothetical protein